jgi:hypothetical protein
MDDFLFPLSLFFIFRIFPDIKNRGKNFWTTGCCAEKKR